MFYEEITYSAAYKDSLQQQIHFNNNIFGKKYCRCNEGPLYLYFEWAMSQHIRKGNLSHRQPEESKASLHSSSISPEPLLFTNMQ